MAIAIAVIVTLRLFLARRRGRRPGRANRNLATVLMLLPVVMVAMAVLSGAFSALGDPLGLALAPFALGVGVILGLSSAPRVDRAGGGRDISASDPTNGSSLWIFIGIVALRMVAVVVSSAGETLWQIVSADLLLIPVGIAGTRLAITVPRLRSQRRAGFGGPSSSHPSDPLVTDSGLAARREITRQMGVRIAALHVLIVGGGIGGLALGQGLRKAGVSVAVFEKGAPHPRATWQEGYQIHINPVGAAALEECLPSAAREQLAARSLRPSSGVQAVNEQLQPIGMMNPRAVSGSTPIVRSTLRSVLLTGLDGIVRFSTTFVRYEGQDDGRIRALFADGTSAVGDLLVGADGIGSRIRAQLLPDAVVRDTGLVGMAGRLPINERSRVFLPESLLTRLTSVRARHGLYMIVTQSVHKASDPDGAASDHVIWVLVSRGDVYDENPQSLFHDGPRLQQIGLQLMSDWHPSLQRMVAETNPDEISATALRGADPIEPWPTTNVTLLGDAVHAMPPVRGLGGSTALRDAALLCRAIRSASENGSPLELAIHAYEAAMLEYGFEAVRASMDMARMVTDPSVQSMGRLREIFGHGAPR